MGQKKIRCEYCGSTNIIRENGCAVVRRVSPETDEPTKKKAYFSSSDVYHAVSSFIGKI